ncbi:MAG: 5-oxoprolinase subunit PxpA [Pricia sp.]
MKKIDINCDVGEGIGNEAQLFPLISSCNIACGGHAGDASSMQRVSRLAKKHGVKVGAHPSYPDKANFGRASLDIPVEQLIQSIRQQIADLKSILEKENIPLHHIKAHGALYNDIAKEADLAETYLDAIQENYNSILLYVPPSSKIEKLALDRGFSIAREAFADRNYNSDLSLVSREHPRALIESPEAVLAHVAQIVNHQKVKTIDDKEVPILADTICIHGDTPLAFQIVSYLSRELPNLNIRIEK